MEGTMGDDGETIVNRPDRDPALMETGKTKVIQ